jgi:hypothetical protein
MPQLSQCPCIPPDNVRGWWQGFCWSQWRPDSPRNRNRRSGGIGRVRGLRWRPGMAVFRKGELKLGPSPVRPTGVGSGTSVFSNLDLKPDGLLRPRSRSRRPQNVSDDVRVMTATSAATPKAHRRFLENHPRTCQVPYGNGRKWARCDRSLAIVPERLTSSTGMSAFTRQGFVGERSIWRRVADSQPCGRWRTCDLVARNVRSGPSGGLRAST